MTCNDRLYVQPVFAWVAIGVAAALYIGDAEGCLSTFDRLIDGDNPHFRLDGCVMSYGAQVQDLPLHFMDQTLLLPVVVEHTVDERSPLYGETWGGGGGLG